MSKIKKLFSTIFFYFWQMRWYVKILLIVLLVGFISSGAILVTSQSSFCNSCHIMDSYYASWETSKHSDVSCIDCHLGRVLWVI